MHTTYRGLDVYGMGPPSSGGTAIGEALNILEGYDLAAVVARPTRRTASSRRRGWRSPTAAPTSPTADYFAVPRDRAAVEGLRRDAARADRRARRARARPRPGDPYPFNGRRQRRRREGVGDVDARGHRRRTSRSPIEHGDVVAYTFTIESTGGSGLVVPGYGFLLNNELTDFDYSSRTHRQPRPGRQAPAQLDLADDRAAPRAPVARARLPRRRDDHHDGAGAARRARSTAAARCRWRSRRRGEPAQHAGDGRRAGVPRRTARRPRSPPAGTCSRSCRDRAPRPASSSGPAAGWWPRRSRFAAAAAARSSCGATALGAHRPQPGSTSHMVARATIFRYSCSSKNSATRKGRP